MKLSLFKTLSLFLILAFSLIYSVTSCSNNNEVDSNSKIDKTSSLEYKNSLYFPKADGSVLKYENNKKAYLISLNTEISASRNTNSKSSSNTYKITNPDTGEFISITDVVKENNYYKFNAKTSNGDQIIDLKYYSDDFLTNLENYSNNKSQRVGKNNQTLCGPCVTVIVTLVIAIIDSQQETPLEQCRSSMQSLGCSGGQNPYMNFSEGWFSTTCNVGCK